MTIVFILFRFDNLTLENFKSPVTNPRRLPLTLMWRWTVKTYFYSKKPSLRLKRINCLNIVNATNRGNNSVLTVKINNAGKLRLALACKRIKNILATEIRKKPIIIEIVGVNRRSTASKILMRKYAYVCILFTGSKVSDAVVRKISIRVCKSTRKLFSCLNFTRA